MNAGSQPSVGLVVPCHNDERYIREALSSIQSQSLEDWVCVVVDDGSSDGSRNEIESAVADDDRFVVVTHNENRGLPAARNTGLSELTTDLVAFLDSDDMLTAKSLENRLDAFITQIRPSVAGSYSHVRMVEESTRLQDLPSAYKSGATSPVDFVTSDGECPFPVNAALTRCDLIMSLDGFDESLVHGGEDWDLWQRLMRSGFVFVPAPMTTAVYRQRPEAMTRRRAVEHVDQAKRLLNAANRPSDPRQLDPSVPTMPLPLGDYRASIMAVRRAIRFAAMALLDGGNGEIKGMFDVFSPEEIALGARHVDIPAEVRAAHRRVRGMTYEATSEDVTAVRNRLANVLGRQFEA